MKRILIFLLLTFASVGLAEDLPVLTPDGLEEFKLGSAPPATSNLEGLTTQNVVTSEWEEGEEYKVNYLKFYLHGEYLGKGIIRDGVLTEITVVSPKVPYEGGFRVGSTWDEIQRVFPGPTLHYTYVTGRLFADSEYQQNVQVDFDTEDHVGPEELRWEFQDLKDSSIKPDSRAKAIRIYKP